MPNSFTLNNFRTFTERTEIDLSPITVLVGPNSSGKSSIMKALMLLKESCNRNNLQRLDFAGGGHKLGSFDEAVSRDEDSDCLEFGFKFPAVSFSREAPDSLKSGLLGEKKQRLFPLALQRPQKTDPSEAHVGPEEVSVTLRFCQNELVSICFGINRGRGHEVLTEVIVPHPEAEKLKSIDVRLEHRRLTSADLSISAEDFQRTIGLYVNGPLMFDLIRESDSNLNWESEMPFLGEELEREYTIVCVRERIHSLESIDEGVFFERGEYPFFPSDVQNEKSDISIDERRHKHIREDLKELSVSCIKKAKEFLQYDNLVNLSHLRSGSKHVYTEDSIPKRFARVLKTVSQDPFPEYWPGTTNPTSRHSHIAKWLKDVGLSSRIEVENIGSSAYVIKVEDNKQMVPINNVGYGISQLVPLILHLAYPSNQEEHNSDSTFFLEEPEANLHPNLQSRIADLLVEVVPGSSRAIVETHSEYLIRRLQLLVARGEASPDDITIYYLGPEPSAEDYVRRITIDEQGQLSQPFGPGFTDQATGLMMDLFKYGRKN